MNRLLRPVLKCFPRRNCYTGKGENTTMQTTSKHSSDRIASLASCLLRRPDVSKETKSLAASVLSQARGSKKRSK
jgi:hypothetical protein